MLLMLRNKVELTINKISLQITIELSIIIKVDISVLQ